MKRFPLTNNILSKLQSGDLEYDELTPNLREALYEYYQEDMPYGTQKARTGDPDEFIFQALMKRKA